jgi:two-component system nitrate/nitrite response regulator NarL
MRKGSSAVVVVGRNSLRKDGIAEILRSANFGVVSSVTCADDLCAGRFLRRQLLFLIIHTGDDFGAAGEQIELLRSRYPHARVAVVADRYRLNELATAFRAGVNGYFVDVTSCGIFIKSLELVMMGEAIFPPAFLSFALDPVGEGEHHGHADTHDGYKSAMATPEDRIAPRLSPREKSILRCLIEGDSNKRIARKINIAEATVKVHIKAILRKIGVHNRTQAAIWGMNNGSPRRPAHNTPPNLSSQAGKLLPLGDPPEAKWIETMNRFELIQADGHVPKEINQNAAELIRPFK